METLLLTNIYAISPIVCAIARRFGVLQVCNSPGNDLLTDLLPVLVGPSLDKPQQAHDLPEVTAAATTKLNISNHTRKPRRKGAFAIQRAINRKGNILERARERGEALR